MEDEKKEEVKKRFKKFLKGRYTKIKKLKLENIKDGLNPNPYMLALLKESYGLETSEDIINYLVDATLAAGFETAYGFAIQDAAKILAGRTSGATEVDIEKDKDGITYYIQIKSGPNTINKTMADGIKKKLDTVRRRTRTGVTILGMTYGNEEKVSSIIRNYLGHDYIIGREFWEFVSDESSTYKEIFELAQEAVEEFEEGEAEGESLKDVAIKKKRELVDEFNQVYGNSGDQMWKNLLEKNS